MLVRKKDNSWRMCVDFRKLNSKTVKDAYPIPRIQDNLDSLNGAQWFSSLDCGMAYHQIPLEVSDRPKTAFATPRGGLYQYVTMPFGLCNAPATFQRIIEKVLVGLQWHILVLYLDDIVVFSKTVDQHITDLETVLGRLEQSGLKLKTKKCQFFSKEVTILGHTVSQNGIKPDLTKIEAVKRIPRPTNNSELRKFLGFTSYFRKFVKDYATIAKPLYNLTRESVTWKWTPECENAFQSLKENLTSYPVLAYPDVDGGQFILDCDASDYGIGAVLSQVQDGVERVIAYGSRTLNNAEENYCVTRREMLALVYFTKYFQEYLIGREFLVRTDHSSLRWLQQFKDPDGQVYRWLEQLSKFNFDIEHRKGAKHTNADYMSRVVKGDQAECRQCHMPLSDSKIIVPDRNETDKIVDVDISVLELGDSSDEDESRNSRQVRERRKRGRKANKPKMSTAKSEPKDVLTRDSICNAQRGDSDLSYVIELIESGATKPAWADICDKSPNVKFWIARWELLGIQNGLLCIKWEFTEENVKWRICIPSSLLPSVLWYIHDAHVSGHLGVKKTMSRAKVCPFYWTKMRESVEEYVRACDICGEANDPQRKKRHALQKYTVGARFERIGIDIAGPHPETARKNSHILVISDYFSKLVEIFPLPNIRAETVADVLFRGWIKRYGCPREIHSDQGRQFESAVFQEMCKMLEISKTRTTPLHARSDGMVERMNRTMQNMLSKYIQENQKDWDLCLDFIVMAYNTCEHESTRCSPYRILYGENIVLPIDILTDDIAEEGTVESEDDISGFVPQLQSNLKRIHAFVRNHLSKSAEKQKKHYDSHVKEICYKVGDLVWRNQKKTVPGVKTKIMRHWTGPWIITEKLCDILFRIKHSDSSSSVIMHGDNLKKYHGPKTIILQNDDQLQRQADQPDLHTFLQFDTQRTVNYACRVDIMADDVIKDGVSSFSAQQTHIPLRSYDHIQNSRNKVFCEENLYRKSLTGEMVGFKSTRELKAFGVLLNSHKSQDYNALAELWPTEHITECLCTGVYSRETEIILAEQRSAEQVNRCINSVHDNF